MAHAPRSLVILGGGGHALVVAEAAALAGLTVAGFLDDDPDAALGAGSPSFPCLGPLRGFGALDGRGWIVGVGGLALRRAVVDALPAGPGGAVSVVHPRAFVSPSARLAGGVYVGPGAVVHSRATVQRHAIINSAAVVEHDCTVGENAHVAPRAVLGGGAAVGEGTLVGLGACVLPGVRVGSRCTVGAGAVVTRDVPDGATVVGLPARATR